MCVALTCHSLLRCWPEPPALSDTRVFVYAMKGVSLCDEIVTLPCTYWTAGLRARKRSGAHRFGALVISLPVLRSGALVMTLLLHRRTYPHVMADNISRKTNLPKSVTQLQLDSRSLSAFDR